MAVTGTAQEFLGSNTGGLSSLLQGRSPAESGYGTGLPPEYQQYYPSAGVQATQQDPYGAYRFQPTADQYGTQQPYGSDVSSPGVAEQAFQQHEREYFEPGSAEQYWNQVMGRFNGGPVETDRAKNEEQYGRVTDTASTLLNTKLPGLDPYYDLEQRQLEDTINRQAAARGTFGSTRTMDILGDASARLAAEKANRSAQYDLERAGEARRWEALGSDVLGQTGAQELAYLTAGMNAAQVADAAERARIAAGMGAATTAQGAFEGRQQTAYDQQLRQLSLLMPLMYGGYSDMLAADERLLDAALSAEMGLAKAAVEADRQQNQDVMQQTDWALNAAGDARSLGIF